MRHIRLFAILSASLLAVLSCDKEAPSAPAAAVLTATPTAGAPLKATATPTPLPGAPLAVLTVTLLPPNPNARGICCRHSVDVHIEARDVRGIPFEAQYETMQSPGSSYSFPNFEDPGTAAFVPPFGSGATDALVSADEDVPCAKTVIVTTRVTTADGKVERFTTRFDCSSAYWPF